jgi:hypothetical protein
MDPFGQNSIPDWAKDLWKWWEHRGELYDSGRDIAAGRSLDSNMPPIDRPSLLQDYLTRLKGTDPNTLASKREYVPQIYPDDSEFSKLLQPPKPPRSLQITRLPDKPMENYVPQHTKLTGPPENALASLIEDGVYPPIGEKWFLKQLQDRLLTNAPMSLEELAWFNATKFGEQGEHPEVFAGGLGPTERYGLGKFLDPKRILKDRQIPIPELNPKNPFTFLGLEKTGFSPDPRWLAIKPPATEVSGDVTKYYANRRPFVDHSLGYKEVPPNILADSLLPPGEIPNPRLGSFDALPYSMEESVYPSKATKTNVGLPFPAPSESELKALFKALPAIGRGALEFGKQGVAGLLGGLGGEALVNTAYNAFVPQWPQWREQRDKEKSQQFWNLPGVKQASQWLENYPGPDKTFTPLFPGLYNADAKEY